MCQAHALFYLNLISSHFFDKETEAQRSLISSVTRMGPCDQNMTSSKGGSMMGCLNTKLGFINPS